MLTKINKIIRNSLLYFLWLLIFTFFCAEVVVRVFLPQGLGPPAFSYHPELGQIPVPNQSAVRTLPEDPEYYVSNDKNGFRNHGFPSGSAKKILVLGDSFTYGTGVSDNETYSSLLQENLPSTHVINAGNPGTGTDYALHLVQKRGAQLKPNIILLGFFANDFIDNGSDRLYLNQASEKLQSSDLPATFSFFRKKQWLLDSSIYHFFCSYSHLVSFARRLAASRSLMGGNISMDFLRGRVDLRPFQAGMATESNILRTKQFIDALKVEAKKLQAKIIFLYIPSQVDIEYYRKNRTFYKDEIAFQKLIGNASFVSFTKKLADTDYSLEKLYLQDGHWSAKSHALAAEFFLSFYRL